LLVHLHYQRTVAHSSPHTHNARGFRDSQKSIRSPASVPIVTTLCALRNRVQIPAGQDISLVFNRHTGSGANSASIQWIAGAGA